MNPPAVALRSLPYRRTTPYPQRDRPGSTPRTNTRSKLPTVAHGRVDPPGVERPRDGAATRALAKGDSAGHGDEQFVRDVEVGPHVLDVVVVLQGLDEAQDPAHFGLVVDGDGRGRDHGELRGFGLDTRRLERVAYRRQIVRRARHHPAVVLVGKVLGARVRGDLHDLVLVERAREADDPLAGELPADRARLGHVAAVADEDVAYLGPRAVAVVGEALDDDGHAARGVALVRDLLVVHSLELARASLDGALDRVERHRGGTRLLEHRAERGIGIDVTAAFTGGHLQLPDHLGEDLGTRLVDRRLAVLGGRPLRMTRHLLPPSLFRARLAVSSSSCFFQFLRPSDRLDHRRLTRPWPAGARPPGDRPREAVASAPLPPPSTRRARARGGPGSTQGGRRRRARFPAGTAPGSPHRRPRRRPRPPKPPQGEPAARRGLRRRHRGA